MSLWNRLQMLKTLEGEGAGGGSGGAGAGAGAGNNGGAGGGSAAQPITITTPEALKPHGKIVEGYTKLATEKKLSAEHAQAALDYFAGHIPPPPPSEYKLNVPQGIKVDQKVLEGFIGVAKQRGLSQEQAQSAIEYVAGLVKTAEDQRQGQIATWQKQVTDDKEIGGPNLDKTKQLVREALGKFGDEQLMKDLEATGVAHHPGIVKFLRKVGLALQEGSGRGAGGGGQHVSDREARLREKYPTMFKGK